MIRPYYSYCYNDEEPESQYQILTHKSFRGKGGSLIKPTGEELFTKFCGVFFTHRDPNFDYEACLDFHYNKYTGNKMEFVTSTRRLLLSKLKIDDFIDQEIAGIISQWSKSKLNSLNLKEDESKSNPQKEGSGFNFENNFDNVNQEKVYQYFSTELVNSNYLSEEELRDYLKTAFEKRETPKSKFSFRNIPSKDKVMKVFYSFYKDIAGKPHGRQKDYAGLLGEYFQGFKTSTISTNFSKSVY